jgi:hypothetical protein
LGIQVGSRETTVWNFPGWQKNKRNNCVELSRLTEEASGKCAEVFHSAEEERTAAWLYQASMDCDTEPSQEKLEEERNCHEGLPGIEMKMDLWTVRQRPGQILKIKLL